MRILISTALDNFELVLTGGHHSQQDCRRKLDFGLAGQNFPLFYCNFRRLLL